MGSSCTSLLTVSRLGKAAIAIESLILICDIGKKVHTHNAGGEGKRGGTEIIRHLVPKLILRTTII
jgi:hypothetical protein